MAFIGVDIGGTKALTVAMDDGRVVAERRSVLDRSTTTIDALIAAIDDTADGPIDAIGIGVAGLVRFADGVFVWGPHVPGTEIPIRSLLTARYDVPIVVDNDANVAALAEFTAGAGVGYRNGLLVTLGTGIGGAIVVDGSVYRGESFAGEWGHVRVAEGGLLCDCGKRGCWETRASGPALARLAAMTSRANRMAPLQEASREATSQAKRLLPLQMLGKRRPEPSWLRLDAPLATVCQTSLPSLIPRS